MVRVSSARRMQSIHGPALDERPRLNAVLEEIVRTGRVSTPNGADVEVHSHISPGKGAFLQRIVGEVRPKVSLEVGLAFGVSALYLCDALAQVGGARHIVIDPNQFADDWGDAWQGAGLENLKRAGHGELVEFFGEPSFRVLPRLEAEGVRLDLAFVDGWHTFDYTLLDLFYIDRMLRPGAVVAIDDAQWPSVRKAIRYFVTNRGHRVHACFKPEGQPAFRRQRWIGALSRALPPLHGLLKPEWVESDAALGIPPATTCVALEKTADDDRAWDFHREF